MDNMATTGLRINYPPRYENAAALNSEAQPNPAPRHVISNHSVYEAGAPSINDNYAPLFQRIGHSDYAELQVCRATLESVQHRVRYLEGINLNLEHRLEKEAKANIELERQCNTIESSWKAKCEALQAEIDMLKQSCDKEKTKNERLREHLSRTERELYSILQRKYELMRNGNIKPGPPTDVGNKIRSGLSPSWETSILKDNDNTSTIEDIHAPQQVRPAKDVHQRKIISNLAEFFGL